MPTSSLPYLYYPVHYPLHYPTHYTPISPQPTQNEPPAVLPQEPAPLPPPVEPDIPLDDEFALALGHRPNPWWLLFRLAFLVYIFSQNASFQRIVMLHVLAVFIWLWQTGRLQIPRGPANRPAVPIVNQQPNQPNRSTNVQMEPQIPVPRSPLREALSMIWSFVFSLIPQAE